MDRLWAPWRSTYVTAANDRRDSCFLCDPDEGNSLFLSATSLSWVVLNRYPYNSGHLLVAPRAHKPNLAALTSDEISDLFLTVREAAGVLTATLSCDGLNIGINQGEVAGGSIADHLHVHIVPRWEGDTNFLPVTAEVKVLPQSLEEAAQRIREGFGKR